MQHSNKLEDMLNDGYSRKFANYYLSHLEAEKNEKIFSEEFIEWSHSHGFFAQSAAYYNLTEDTVDDYLSEYDYYRIWPVNNWTRIWINDKLTLKYALNGTKYSNYLPKYYFYCDCEKGLIPLMDTTGNAEHINTHFIEMLKSVKVFACKPNNGTSSKGFHKLSYHAGKFYIDDIETSEANILEFTKENPNFIYTEYLVSHDYFQKYNPLIHTLRLVTINPSGNRPRIVSGCVRIPNTFCATSNYLTSFDKNTYNLYTIIDLETGVFKESILEYPDHLQVTNVHPDNNLSLDGAMPDYNKLKDDILGISTYFNNIEYMGYDIGLTPDGYKIMEINSHPGIPTYQIHVPYFKDAGLGPWFKDKIAKIDTMSAEQKKLRNNIER